MPVVSAESVAARLGLPLPLSATTAVRIAAAVEDAEAKVVGELHRPVVAVEDTALDLYPAYGWPLDDYRAWPEVEYRYNDVYEVKNFVPAVSGDPDLYDVTFAVGLDVANDPDLLTIKQFIVQDALAGLRNDPGFTEAPRAVTSVSAEGQSVSYDKGSGAPDSAGGGLTLNSLRRWKRRAVYQRRTRAITPWPNY